MLKNYINKLRKEPEHVRLRHASIATAISGGFLVIVWATLLLPAQLKFAPGANTEKTTEPDIAGVSNILPQQPDTAELAPVVVTSPSPSPTPEEKVELETLPLSE